MLTQPRYWINDLDPEEDKLVFVDEKKIYYRKVIDH